jgi:hypothetical protein
MFVLCGVGAAFTCKRLQRDQLTSFVALIGRQMQEHYKKRAVINLLGHASSARAPHPDEAARITRDPSTPWQEVGLKCSARQRTESTGCSFLSRSLCSIRSNERAEASWKERGQAGLRLA